MANTVVAIFEKEEQAQAAQSELLTHGFSQSQINVKTATYKSNAVNPEETEEEHGLLDSITTFFRDLFGADHKDIPHYAAAGKHRTIVTAHADAYEDAEIISNLLDQHGAINVNETSGSYFPEKEETTTQHQFLDDALHHPSQKPSYEEDSEISTRASGIKSRIIQRSADKGGFTEEN